MATTSPDDIWTPDAGDDYALTTDLAAMADTIQDALTARPQNYRVGLDSARVTPVGWTPTEGVKYYSTDTNIEWVYNGTAWAWTPRNLARLELAANQVIATGGLVQINNLSYAFTAPTAGRVRLTLHAITFSGAVGDLLEFKFRDGTTALQAMTTAANSSPTAASTGRSGSFVFDVDVASGAHTLNVSGQVASGGAVTVSSSAGSRTILMVDWLG